MKTIAQRCTGFFLSAFLVACSGAGDGGDGHAKRSPSLLAAEKAITSYALAGSQGTIDESRKTISVDLPFGTETASLVATFKTTGVRVAVGTTEQESGVTANDFAAPVVYRVTAADGSTAQYTVTARVALADAKAMTSFALAGVPAVIDEAAKTIRVTLPFGTNVTALVATFATSGASVKVGAVSQVSGVTANDFSSPVAYRVTAADGTFADYTVTVTVALNSAKAMLTFALAGTSAVITEATKSVAVTLPYGSSVTALAATFTTSGAGVKVGATAQVSGVTVNNFSTAVVYTVSADDGSSVNYTVTVTVELNSAKAMVSFALPGAAVVLDETGKAVAVKLQTGTDVTALVATFSFTGAGVKVGATAQVSGVTPNNFSAPVIYTVVAENGSAVNYTVTVTLVPPATLGGTVTGLPAGMNLVLQNNAGDDLTVSYDGPFTFATALPYGTAYRVAIVTQPATGACTLTHELGTAHWDNVSGVRVICGAPFAGAFTSTGSMPLGKAHFTATLLPDGQVLAAGGLFTLSPGSNTLLPYAYLYDPLAGTWATTANVTPPYGRNYHTATLLGDGTVLVCGGMTYAGAYVPAATCETYYPSAGTWSATGSLSFARTQHTATLLPNGKILVAGGTGASSVMSSVEIYDPLTRQWTPAANLGVARHAHAAVLLSGGKVLVAGGWGVSGLTTSAELYDPETDTWTPVGDMASSRQGQTATLLPGGNVLVAGGSASVLAAEIYYATAGTWATTGNMAAAVAGHTATLLPTGNVLVTGGGGTSPGVNDAQIFYPAAGTWGTTSGMSTARRNHTATLLQDGRVLVTGGGDASGATPTVSASELYH